MSDYDKLLVFLLFFGILHFIIEQFLLSKIYRLEYELKIKKGE